MKKNKILPILLLALLLGLSSCKTEEAAEPAAGGEEIAETLPAVEEPALAYVDPLSGLRVAEDIENNRPYAIMLNNKKEALPHLGVSGADIIYEICAEGGITRMEAIFQSVKGIPNIGSIRSIRPYYIEIATGYDALIIHAGGSEEAYANLRQWKLTHFDGVRGGYDASIFWRDPYRMEHAGYEHSMLTSGENILEYISGTDIRRQHEEDYKFPLSFGEENAAGRGRMVKQISVRFSNYSTSVFNYDRKGKVFKVDVHGGPYVDGNTGEQIAVTNLLVLETGSKVLDSEGRLKVNTTGSGVGHYYCDGRAVEITWSRADRNQPFLYALEDGTPLSLMPGKTYICVINPHVSKLTEVENAKLKQK